MSVPSSNIPTSNMPSVGLGRDLTKGPNWIQLAWSLVAPFVGLLVVGLLFGLIYPVGYPHLHRFLPEWMQLGMPGDWFLTPFRMSLIAKQTAIVGVGAIGMTVIIIGGGIDLSVGSILALAAVVLAVSINAGMSPLLALVIALAAGTAAGAVNGLLITRLQLVPFIVTVGTMLAYRGLAERTAHQTKVQAPNAPDWLSTLLNAPPQGSWRLVCTGVWIVVGLGIVVAAILRYTVFGRYVYALGSNEATSRLCGINVNLMKVAIYAIGGLFMAVGGVFDFNDAYKQGNPTSGLGLELKIIAAVVIGGGSLNGGRGSVLGSIIGALTMTTLTSGCVYAKVSDPVQKIIIGAIIVGAVAIDRFAHRGRE